MHLQDIKGRLGFANIHPKDRILHRPLMRELRASRRPFSVLRHTIVEDGVWRGEPTLAELAAKWAIGKEVDILVTPALGDHPDHDAAANIGRLAARIQGLGLLELQPYRGISRRTLQPQGPRSGDQPLNATDFIVPRHIAHYPPEGPTTYLWTAPDASAVRMPVIVGVD